MITFKNGKRFDADLAMGQDESNWFLQIAEDHVPPRPPRCPSGSAVSSMRSRASARPRSIGSLSSAERLDIDKALELQDIFHQVRAQQGLPLRDALRAVYASFLDQQLHHADRPAAAAARAAVCTRAAARRLGSAADGGMSDVEQCRTQPPSAKHS